MTYRALKGYMNTVPEAAFMPFKAITGLFTSYPIGYWNLMTFVTPAALTVAVLTGLGNYKIRRL